MPGTITPPQMFDHELNPVKGWPSPYGLDKSGPFASDAEQAAIKAGMVVQLDATGKFTRGCANGAMPIFAFPNGLDFDVASDKGNISGGNLVGLVATGGYELETTEISGAGFAPNVPLTPDATTGLVKATTIGSADMVVGVCSGETFTNEFKKTFLRFWPVYMPKR